MANKISRKTYASISSTNSVTALSLLFVSTLLVTPAVASLHGDNIERTPIDPTAKVTEAIWNGLSESERDLMLYLQNYYRQKEDKAANMNKVEWSEYLELEASKWVENCDFKHQVMPSWGENIYRSTYDTTTELAMDNGLAAWQLERNNNLDADSGVWDCCTGIKKTCCYASQLLWANSEYVGCALKFCTKLKGVKPSDDYTNAMFMACYYYPPGNVLNKQPYEINQGQCSLCNATTNPDCDNGLCFWDPRRC